MSDQYAILLKILNDYKIKRKQRSSVLLKVALLWLSSEYGGRGVVMRVYTGIDQSGGSISVTCNTTVTQWSRNKEKESGSHKKDRQEVQFHFNVYFSRKNLSYSWDVC